MTDNSLPIVCALAGDDLKSRLAEIRTVSRAALRVKRHDGPHAELCFAPLPGILERVAAIVAAESQCCAFLTMRLEQTPAEIILTIDVPDDAEPVLEQLLDAFELVRA